MEKRRLKISEAVPGTRIGFLVIEELLPTSGTRGHSRKCRARCDCGSTKDYRVTNLGFTTLSCGCMASTIAEKSFRINRGYDGPTHKRTKAAWHAMWHRTTTVTNAGYVRYKDKAPPEKWRSYLAFLQDMGECPENLTLERLDNRKPYSPDNCEWSTKTAQNRNRTSNVYVKFRGRVIPRSELAEILGIHNGNLRAKLRTGKVSLQSLISEPVAEATYDDFVQFELSKRKNTSNEATNV